MAIRRIGVGLAVFGCVATVCAKPKPVMPADYGQFESLGASVLSPDGKWLAYAINRSNRNNELRITNIGSGETKVAAFGGQPVFSSDSLWISYAVGVSEAEEEKLQKAKKPVRRKLAIRNLVKDEVTIVDSIESFAFSPNGLYLAMRRYPPEKPTPTTPPAPGSEPPETPPPGATLVVRELDTKRDFTFGNVSEYAWQDLPKTGRLLAIAVSVDDKTGNGVQLFDPDSGSMQALDSGSAVFSGLSWRKKSSDLAVLRSYDDEKYDGSTHVLLAWTRLDQSSGTAHRFDPTSSGALPAEIRTVAYRKPLWSDDGEVIFVGLSKWDKKPPKKAEAGTESKDSNGSRDKDGKDPKEPDEQPSVDVWHWRDNDVMPKQKVGLKGDRERSMLAAWNIGSNRLFRLGHVYTETITPIKHHKLAAAVTWTAYAMDRSIGRPAAELSLVDVTSGERIKIKDRIRDDQYVQVSPAGRYLIYVQDDHYWAVNTGTRAAVNLTESIPTSFIDRESDYTVKQKPPFGVAGWTKGDEAVILYDKFDLWRILPDGKGAKKLTDGAAEQVRHRYIRLDPEAEFIDMTKPVYVSRFGLWTKKSGYGRIVSDRHETLLWDDSMIGRLTKARDAETYVYTKQTIEQSQNFFVTAGDLKAEKKVTDTNPFQNKYAWARSELVEYKNRQDKRLQGSLYYPAGFEAGKKYPMVVYLYEKLSDNLHRYIAPSERDYYNAAAFNANGYFVLMPDIIFLPREPGVSVADCVSAAVKSVLAKGHVDPKRIGVMGHSWGGFDASYLATHTHLFAAAVAGAPITNLVSNYGNHHWQSGIAETDHIETGQQRMEVPLWEDLQAYIRNSAVFGVQNMTTPLLIEVGDVDGTVFYHQGVELYNIARRAGKNVVLLVYAAEDHGLRKRVNQIDYHRRIQAWFAHHLKGERGEAWITEGESHLQRQQMLKTLKTAASN